MLNVRLTVRLDDKQRGTACAPYGRRVLLELELRGRVDDATRRLQELPLSEADQEAWGAHLDRLAGRALNESVVRDLEAEVEGAVDDARRRSP